eukprot:TRINITY_DN1022_c0_g1_i15.p1 TRINITY_DN1022_c0_g1~~TRINITY_DN1022_c0_g1_i15.p1  ORF type:complete len:156 (-),score=34.62 TRINITY_DN1022_c0_g1_i15:188-625(-)
MCIRDSINAEYMGGINTSDECIKEFNEMKMKKKYQYLIFQIIDNKIIQIEKKGERNSQYADFVKQLPPNQPRYCIFDYHMQYKDGRQQDKLVYIHWCPDTAKVDLKMVSATNNTSFVQQLQGVQYQIQANDLSDVDEKEIQSKFK